MQRNSLSLLLLSIVFIGWSCGQKSAEGNQALYDSVMQVHDEVMPKMDALYNLARKLRDKAANTPDLSEAEQETLTDAALEVEIAQEGMMAWMRNFDPIPDTEGEDKARAYLEDQMEKIEKVRDDIYAALKHAEKVNE